MKISYVIPARNEEARIGKCLESIVAHIKKYPHDAEIIVVSSSTDKTKEIALSFPGVKVIDERRKGVARARDTGYRASTGDLIAGIDADIIMMDGWVEKVLGFFKADQKLVALSGPHIFYDMPKRIQAVANIFYGMGVTVDFINQALFQVGSLLQGGNFVVRRTALDKINGWNTEFVFYGEDIDLGRRLSAVGKVKFTFDLPIYASGRRVAAEGVVVMGMKYGINFIWTTFFKKPFSKESIAIRPEMVKKLDLKKAKEYVKKGRKQEF